MTPRLQLAVQFSIGFIFLASSLGKLTHPRDFSEGVADYRLIPTVLAVPVAVLFILAEIFLAASHLTSWLLHAAFPIGIATLSAFAMGVSINLWRGRALPCHCFGGRSSEIISVRTLGRLLLILSGEVFLLADSKFMAPGRIYPSPFGSPSDLSLSVTGGILIVLTGMWLLSVGEVIALLHTTG